MRADDTGTPSQPEPAPRTHASKWPSCCLARLAIACSRVPGCLRCLACLLLGFLQGKFVPMLDADTSKVARHGVLTHGRRPEGQTQARQLGNTEYYLNKGVCAATVLGRYAWHDVCENAERIPATCCTPPSRKHETAMQAGETG